MFISHFFAIACKSMIDRDVVISFAQFRWLTMSANLWLTPAMQPGLATHLWSLEEIVGLLDRRAKLVP
jgi:hypothetical protein